jgi:hypothetical protein
MSDNVTAAGHVVIHIAALDCLQWHGKIENPAASH